MRTGGEEVRVEANVEGGVADGAHGLAGIQDHLPAFGVWDRTKNKT